MVTINLTERLTEGAKELKDLDKEILKDIIELRHEQIFGHIEQFTEKRQALRKDLLHFSSYTIENQETREIIDKVLDCHEFNADQVLKSLLAQTGKTDIEKTVEEFNALSNEDLVDLAHEHFYSWIGPVGIAERLYEMGALVLSAQPPANLKKYVTEALWCYALEQYLAVYSLCRTILEISIRELGQEIGKLPKDKGNLKPKILRVFQDMKRLVVPIEMVKEVDEIYLPACGLVHGTATVGPKEAKEMLRKTLKCVQRLYEHYNVKLPS
jgi:hypothetical protein